MPDQHQDDDGGDDEGFDWSSCTRRQETCVARQIARLNKASFWGWTSVGAGWPTWASRGPRSWRWPSSCDRQGGHGGGPACTPTSACATAKDRSSSWRRAGRTAAGNSSNRTGSRSARPLAGHCAAPPPPTKAPFRANSTPLATTSTPANAPLVVPGILLYQVHLTLSKPEQK